ncbi:hypothetical protein HB364_16010 [Pseudoflavitalea sp. X16]|uniref:hypothetical protein n=1 Tax=Paraflavitalea devenefica TaxID=2716334 RepID=UPI00142249C5|nr:hypothetical protein [Paraflavitalea devenefica]NII26594.1 hypothetical protein [Paraflavitalea devenefica]
MEMHDFLPTVVKTLMVAALSGLFLLMLFAEKIRSKEKSSRNIIITLGSSLVATLVFSTITVFLLYENFTASLSSELMPVGAQIFSFLTILSFIPVLIAFCKIATLLLRKKQRHA